MIGLIIMNHGDGRENCCIGDAVDDARGTSAFLCSYEYNVATTKVNGGQRVPVCSR